MTHDRFDRLVHTLEPKARHWPRLYCAMVIGFALLGNLYLVLVLLLLFSLLLALLVSVVKLKALAIKLLIPLVCFIGLVVKALWVRFEPPTGSALSPKQTPRLFELIETLRRRLGSPRFHRVLLTDDFNAGICQVPRLGVFGWPCNYLVVGLPLMKALTVDQFTAVLAHEFGHLAKRHGNSSRWVYSQRCRWQRLSEAFENNGGRGSFLFKPLLKWFAPYFSACSFPLARANEYEADAHSARLTSPRIAAQALSAIKVVGAFLSERYWPKLYEQADRLIEPNHMPYSALSTALADEITAQDSLHWLDCAFQQKPTRPIRTPPCATASRRWVRFRNSRNPRAPRLIRCSTSTLRRSPHILTTRGGKIRKRPGPTIATPQRRDAQRWRCWKRGSPMAKR